jgi:hypothetical protein
VRQQSGLIGFITKKEASIPALVQVRNMNKIYQDLREGLRLDGSKVTLNIKDDDLAYIDADSDDVFGFISRLEYCVILHLSSGSVVEASWKQRHLRRAFVVAMTAIRSHRKGAKCSSARYVAPQRVIPKYSNIQGTPLWY